MWFSNFVSRPDLPNPPAEKPPQDMHSIRSYPLTTTPGFHEDAASPSVGDRETPPAATVPTQFRFIHYPPQMHTPLYPVRMDPTAPNGPEWTAHALSIQAATNHLDPCSPSDLPSPDHTGAPRGRVGDLPHFNYPPNSYCPGYSDRYYDTVTGPSQTVLRPGSTIYTDPSQRWHPYMCPPEMNTRGTMTEQQHRPGYPAQSDSALLREFSPTSSVNPEYPPPPPENIASPLLQSAAAPSGSFPKDDKVRVDKVRVDPENVIGVPFLPEHPEWTLTSDLYQWIFAVLYPKKRPNKKIPTPTGACRLCRSDCKRPGILQQHVRVLHRQRLARRAFAGQSFNVELALAFVVAEIRSASPQPEGNPLVLAECDEFWGLVDRPGGLGSLSLHKFPLLRAKLEELIEGDDWIGVQCKGCGMWATRQVALNEHTAVCTARKQADSDADAESSVQYQLRFTPSGLAVRPPRKRQQD